MSCRFWYRVVLRRFGCGGAQLGHVAELSRAEAGRVASLKALGGSIAPLSRQVDEEAVRVDALALGLGRTISPDINAVVACEVGDGGVLLWLFLATGPEWVRLHSIRGPWKRPPFGVRERSLDN